MECVRASKSGPEAGFGIVEILISMFLLGLLAIAFLPLLIGSMRTTVVNTTTATATQLVNQHLELARAAGATCTGITTFKDEALSAVTDSRGVRYEPERIVGSCSPVTGDYPATVSVTVSAIPDTGVPVSATTLIYLEGP